MLQENFENVFTVEELENISKEFSRLKGKTYLDHAGASLCPESALRRIAEDQIQNLYSNPHTSKETSDQIDQIRYLVLDHLNADPDEYSLIFTSGTTAALKLVAETFDYGNSGAFVYLEDNHTSVLGMRELASSNGAKIINISKESMTEFKNIPDTMGRSLFVYPAQCNFNGFKYSLGWIESIQKHEGSYVFLDTAALLSTSSLDLSSYKPDFCCISFYKLFGFPTGLGALIVKNGSSHLLSKKYYGGGTVEIAMSRTNYHVKRECLYERFEDGTIPFLSIIMLKHCFDAMNKIIGTNFMSKISRHTFSLARSLYVRLKSLHHSNGKPVVKLYADSDYDDINVQGGIVNFNVVRSNGQYIGYAEVVHMSELFNIYIRSGCFCNPGACQRHLQLTHEDLMKHFHAGHKCGDDNDLIDGVPTGSVRVSFGYMSTENDVEALMMMIIKCFVDGEPIYDYSGISAVTQKINPEIPKHKIISNQIDVFSNLSIGCDMENAVYKGKLKDIFLYPVKSCGALRVNSWEIGPKGLLYDRDWMIVTEKGVALTQKQETRMCLIRPSIDLENGLLTLSFPGVDDISIKIDHHQRPKTSICHSKVCGDKISGADCGDEIAAWLSDVLIVPGLRLLKQTEDGLRVGKKFTINSPSISLNNQAQYLIVNLASVEWLADKVQSGEFDERMDNLLARFRGNLVIETKKEFEEFSWNQLTIRSNSFSVDGPCTRCQMVCIDQETGDKTTEPLRTISHELKGKLHFGAYASLIKSNDRKSIIQCGDVIWATLKEHNKIS